VSALNLFAVVLGAQVAHSVLFIGYSWARGKLREREEVALFMVLAARQAEAQRVAREQAKRKEGYN